MARRPLGALEDGSPPDVTCGYLVGPGVSGSRGAVDKALKNGRLRG
jgi:hypothetical protein